MCIAVSGGNSGYDERGIKRENPPSWKGQSEPKADFRPVRGRA